MPDVTPIGTCFPQPLFTYKLSGVIATLTACFGISVSMENYQPVRTTRFSIQSIHWDVAEQKPDRQVLVVLQVVVEVEVVGGRGEGREIIKTPL